MQLGTHVLKYPAGRYGFVGSLPVELAEIVPASTADVLGCRAWQNADGQLVTYRFPTFGTVAEAVQRARAAGVKLCANPECACVALLGHTEEADVMSCDEVKAATAHPFSSLEEVQS